jgi:hypothetical protein
MVDCWMRLYDRWSAVDDVGSLAVVQHMLTCMQGAREQRAAVPAIVSFQFHRMSTKRQRFRQSLLLSRHAYQVPKLIIAFLFILYCYTFYVG